jgi:hypothetical protein
VAPRRRAYKCLKPVRAPRALRGLRFKRRVFSRTLNTQHVVSRMPRADKHVWMMRVAELFHRC